MEGFRLIFSDSLVDGGQQVKTFSERLGSIEDILGQLRAHFGFDDVCRRRGVDPTGVHVDSTPRTISVTGKDGARRIPLRNAEQLSNFVLSLQNKMPSIEVQIVGPPGLPDPVVAAARQRQKNIVEELEHENANLLRAHDKVERRVTELERHRERDKADIMDHIEAHVLGPLNAAIKVLTDQLKHVNEVEITSLKKADVDANLDIETLKHQLKGLEVKQDERQVQNTEKFEDLDARMQGTFGTAFKDIADLQGRATAFEEKTQNDVKELQDRASAFETRADKDIKDLQERSTAFEAKTEAELVTRKECTERLAVVDSELGEKLALWPGARAELEAAAQDCDEKHVEREDSMETALEGRCARLRQSLEAQNTALRAEQADAKKVTENNLISFQNTVTEQDALVASRIQEMKVEWSKKSEGMLKAHSDRFSGVEKAIDRGLAEVKVKATSELRTEIDRLSKLVEQETSQLDEALGELHVKHDVAKQEINFCHSSLQELRDGVARKFEEVTLGIETFNSKAAEQHGESTKKLEALKERQAGFVEKMTEKVAQLQGECASHRNGIAELESARAQMRPDIDQLVERQETDIDRLDKDIDNVIETHKNYTTEMEGWVGDANKQVERLFLAMHPRKVIWRIEDAAGRAASMARPKCLRSDEFTLRGLRGGVARMVFYPNGANDSPDGNAALHIQLPNGAKVRYQAKLGSIRRGPREFKGSPMDSTPFLFDSWTSEISKDEKDITIELEILRDYRDTDQLLEPLRIESLADGAKPAA